MSNIDINEIRRGVDKVGHIGPGMTHQLCDAYEAMKAENARLALGDQWVYEKVEELGATFTEIVEALEWTDRRLGEVLARVPVKDITECRENNKRLLSDHV